MFAVRFILLIGLGHLLTAGSVSFRMQHSKPGNPGDAMDAENPGDVFEEAQRQRVSDGWRASGKQYQGFKVIAFVPENKEQASLLYDMANTQEGVMRWTDDFAPNVLVQLLVSPAQLENVTQMLRSRANETNETNRTRWTDPTVMIEDISVLLQREHVSNLKAFKQRDPDDIVGRYARFGEICKWLQQTSEKSGGVMKLKNIGVTDAQHPIVLARIKRSESDELPVMYIECGIHAREWVSPASCISYIDRLVIHPNQEIQDLLTRMEFHIVPVVNPDGYEFSHQQDRFWRKNRAGNNGAYCRGVDLNRNFDYNHEPHLQLCSEIYAGPNAFSEVEAIAIRDHILAEKHRIKGFFDMHSFSQFLLYPPGSGPNPPDEDNLAAVGETIVRKIRQKHGVNYTAGSVVGKLYPATGLAMDWAHGPAAEVKYSYTIELRPGGPVSASGFILPADQILDTADESWAGIRFVVDRILQENGI